MKRILILGVMMLCTVHATRQEVAEELTRELRLAGHNLAGGPWDVNDEKSGMLGQKALWGWYDKDGYKLWLYDKDRKLSGCCDKDGKWIGWYYKDRPYLQHRS